MTSQWEKVSMSLILFDVLNNWASACSWRRWKEKSAVFSEYLYVTETFDLYISRYLISHSFYMEYKVSATFLMVINQAGYIHRV